MSTSTEGTNETVQYKAVPYRWVILLVFMFVALMTQILWITFAPIMSDVAPHYGVTPDDILLLTAIYMIIYIPVNFPATWILDKYGLKWGTGLGVILVGVFGFLRAFSGTDYNFLLVTQIMTAIGQPFILNSFTKVAVNWFPEKEKATATGIGTISILLGILIGIAITPFIYENSNIDSTLMLYGILSLVSMILYFLFVKNEPDSPPNEFAGQKAFDYSGIKNIFSNKSFLVLCWLMFIGMGVFNAISSDVDVIFARITLPAEAPGLLGGIIIIGGIIGAGILSTISDMTKKRVFFLKIAMVAATLLTYLLIEFNDFTTTAIIAFAFGFFIVSALPVGLIYAAEITYPVTEEASNGIALMLGQISGILFLVLFSLGVNMTMVLFTIFFLTALLLSFTLKDKEPIEVTT